MFFGGCYAVKLTLEALVLLANQVLDGDLDILEGHVGGTTAPDTLAVHTTSADTASLTLNQQHAEAFHTRLASANSSGEVISPDTVGDPLLLTVDDVVLAILGELSLTAEVGDITARIGLGNSQANTLVTSQNAGQDTVNELLLAKLDQGRATNAVTTDQVPDQTTATSTRQLVGQQHLVEQIPALRRHRLDPVWGVLLGVLDTQQTGQVAALTHLLVDLVGDILGLIPLGDVGLDLGVDPFADFLTESGVRVVEVRGGVLSRGSPTLALLHHHHQELPVKKTYTLVPRGVGEGNQITIGILGLGCGCGLVVGRGSLCYRGGLLGLWGGSRRRLNDLLCV